jgi:N-methylhydantoinase B
MMYTLAGVEEIPTKILHTFGVEQPESPGMFGGHPSCTNQFAILRRSDVEARFARGEMPGELAEMRGDLEVYPAYQSTAMRRGDVYRTASQGGGGYGDPLDRDPARVAQDVENGLVTTDWARRAYGVALDAEGTVDEGGTRRARDEIRAARRTAAGLDGKPRLQPALWHPEREGVRVAEAVYGELEEGALRLRCRCGHVLGPADRSPKLGAAMARLPVQAIGPEVNPHAVGGARFELREFYCPACLTRLETEIARPGDPVVDDARIAVAWLAREAGAKGG